MVSFRIVKVIKGQHVTTTSPLCGETIRNIICSYLHTPFPLSYSRGTHSADLRLTDLILYICKL